MHQAWLLYEITYEQLQLDATVMRQERVEIDARGIIKVVSFAQHAADSNAVCALYIHSFVTGHVIALEGLVIIIVSLLNTVQCLP